MFFESKKARLEREKAERMRKAANEAQAKKAKYEILTTSEKQQLSLLGSEKLKVALKAFDKAVNGDAEAMAFMGYTYRLDLKNPTKSAYWIEKAANAGYLDAKCWLGIYYMEGYGVLENRTKGTFMIMESAKKGNKLAIKCLIEDYNMSKQEMRSLGIPV